MENGDYQHCTFSTISFKDAHIKHTRFLNCIFVACYFRGTTVTDTSFVGCRFVDCNFNHISLKSCDFRYARFIGCQLLFEEMRHNLPPQPNLKEELARNLAIESSTAGLSGDRRSYRLAQIEAHQAHLWAAIRGDSAWYRSHFRGIRRASAAWQLAVGVLNQKLLGSGEQPLRLLAMLALGTFGVFPALFYIFRSRLSGNMNSLGEVLWYSVSNVIPGGIHTEVVAMTFITRTLAVVESTFSIIILAFFASYVFRWSINR